MPFAWQIASGFTRRIHSDTSHQDEMSFKNFGTILFWHGSGNDLSESKVSHGAYLAFFSAIR